MIRTTGSILAAMVTIGVVGPAPELLAGGFQCFSADQFVVDLWEDEGPKSKFPVDEANPLTLKAAMGETESALLIVRAVKGIAALEIMPSPLIGKDYTIAATQVSVRIVKSVRRAGVHGEQVGVRYPTRYSREEGIILPDILVRNEPALDMMVRKWNGCLGDEEAANRATANPIKGGRFKYFLFRVAVPDSALPGEYSGRIEIGDNARRLSVPVKLVVYPFVLQQPRGKVLGISNEFGSTDHPLFVPSLRLLADVGMNSTRITADMVSSKDAKRAFELLGMYGFVNVSQDRPPADASDLKKIPADFNYFFYGVDEPQPKRNRPGRGNWERMSEHVKLSRRIHEMGGKVKTSIPFGLAMELTNKESRLYKELEKFGIRGYCEPLDWANYPLGIQYIGRRPKTLEDLFSYISILQKEFRQVEWDEKGVSLPSKNNWLETYYWPQGLTRHPYFARLLCGFYLFNTHLDGVQIWTLYRVRGENPLVESSTPVATLAYPGEKTFYSTYSLEAVREGVDDLRYAQQAYRAISRLLHAKDRDRKARGKKLKERFLRLLTPYSELVVDGQRIDLAHREPERGLRTAREELARMIVEAIDIGGKE